MLSYVFKNRVKAGIKIKLMLIYAYLRSIIVEENFERAS